MTDLHSLLNDAAQPQGGGGDFADTHHGTVRSRIRRRRTVRAAGIGSAAAVSVGAVALGVANLGPGHTEEAQPASGGTPATSLTADASIDTQSPAPLNDSTMGDTQWYSAQDAATGEILSSLVPGDEPNTAILTVADGSQFLLKANDAGTYVFEDQIDGETVWAEVTPDDLPGKPSNVQVGYGGHKPENPASERTPLE
ncbi:hypothetical protein [Demequina sediminicola]|uniref:hypothetical protein n=1 Tax=Demequina sediminicola TaxID=1095026 RepID=UPI000785F4BF|nr:hypothetical protein [Demequina sediminicola]